MYLEGLNKTVHKFFWHFFLWLLCCFLCLSLPFKYPYFLGNPLPGLFLLLTCSKIISSTIFFTYPGLPNLFSLTSHPTSRLTFAVSFSIFYSVIYCNSPFQQMNSSSSSRDLLPLLSFRNWYHLPPKPAA